MISALELSPPPVSEGVSEESDYIKKYIIEQRQIISDNLSLPIASQRLGEVRFALMMIKNDHSDENWDGQGALPVSLEAYNDADMFLRLLDTNRLPYPEINPNPDGSLELEWYSSPDNILSIIFNGNGYLGFASIIGTDDKTYGTRRFKGFIPNDIVSQIDKIA